jgi:hypothetical protein
MSPKVSYSPVQGRIGLRSPWDGITCSNIQMWPVFKKNGFDSKVNSKNVDNLLWSIIITNSNDAQLVQQR